MSRRDERAPAAPDTVETVGARTTTARTATVSPRGGARPRRRSLAALRTTAVLLAAGLSVLAWVTLVGWSASPHARYLEHDGLAHSGLGTPATAGIFVGGWTLMLLAMMLPSTYPLLLAFERVVSRRHNRARLVATVVAGYLAIWTVVGVIAFVGDTTLHWIEHRVPAIAANGELIVAGALALAGAFQFSPLKHRCLDLCRSPRAVVMTHWEGTRPSLESLRLGWTHGRSCVGCCWALMLVMFAVGHGNLGWMLLLGAVMTVEKVSPVGRPLSSATGVVLLLAATATLIGA